MDDVRCQRPALLSSTITPVACRTGTHTSWYPNGSKAIEGEILRRQTRRRVASMDPDGSKNGTDVYKDDEKIWRRRRWSQTKFDSLTPISLRHSIEDSRRFDRRERNAVRRKRTCSTPPAHPIPVRARRDDRRQAAPRRPARGSALIPASSGAAARRARRCESGRSHRHSAGEVAARCPVDRIGVPVAADMIPSPTARISSRSTFPFARASRCWSPTIQDRRQAPHCAIAETISTIGREARLLGAERRASRRDARRVVKPNGCRKVRQQSDEPSS